MFPVYSNTNKILFEAPEKR